MATTDYGWAGKILFVDLTSGKVETAPTSNYVPQWIGGRALAAKLYWDEVPPSCGALDPENRLIFAAGPAVGTLGAGATRTSVATKSPVTTPECYEISTPGGHWSAELKFAGFDAIVVRGKAKDPSYIWINNGEVQVLRADRLWGLKTSQTITEIQKLWGDNTKLMLIGPAGENLVKSSVIQTDDAHAAAMTGFGAVMGSKNLKAIAVRGTGGTKVARPKDLIAFYDENVKIGGKYGGPYQISVESYNVYHGAPASLKPTEDLDTYFNNVDSDWAKNHWLGYEEAMAGTLMRKFHGCFACPACCDLAYLPKDPTGNEPAPKNLNPSMTMGQQCFEYPFWNELEDKAFGDKRMGRPTILNYASHQELGATMYDMSYHQNWLNAAISAGLLTNDNTGLPLDKMLSAEFMGPKGYTYGITYRTNDFFKRLAEGQTKFLEGMAKESAGWKTIYDTFVQRPFYYIDYLSPAGSKDALGMLLNGTSIRSQPNDTVGHFTGAGKQLWTGFMPSAEITKAEVAVRAKWAALLGPKSFDMSGEPKTFEGKVRSAIFFQHMQIEQDSMPYCAWMGFPRFYSLWTDDHIGDPAVGVKMLAAITGIDRTMEENVNSFEAAWNLERAIRVREGQRRQHDWYSDLVFEKNKDWTSKDAFNKVLDDYYTARGWDVTTGIPTRKKLEALGLKDVADDLENKYGVKLSA